GLTCLTILVRESWNELQRSSLFSPGRRDAQKGVAAPEYWDRNVAGMRFSITQRIRRVGLIGTFGLDENCAPQLEAGSSEIGMVDSALSIVASVRSAHGR